MSTAIQDRLEDGVHDDDAEEEEEDLKTVFAMRAFAVFDHLHRR